MTEINPYIRRAWYDQLNPGLVIGPRIILDYELLYIKDGKCTITVENRRYTPQRGDFFLFRPGIEHSILVDAQTPLIQPHIHFDLNKRDDSPITPICMVPKSELGSEHLAQLRPDELGAAGIVADCFHPADTRLLETMLIDVISAHAHRSSYLDEFKVRYLFFLLLYRVLFEIKLSVRAGASTRNATAERVKACLEHNTHRDISIDELAAQCFVSKCYMISAFRQVYGITPHRYHQSLRVNKAKYMLRFTNLSVSAISGELGFANIHAFSTLFRRIEGKSPTQYRDVSQRMLQSAPAPH